MNPTGPPPLAGTRVYRHHHLDSTRWKHLPLRDDDIVVTTPYKCGTTWTQRILAALVHGADTKLSRELSPWVDARFWGPIEPIAAALAAQTHRRFMKSHLPLDGTTWDDRVSFIVVGRDPRDVFMSLVNHYGAYGEVALGRVNDPGNPGEPIPPFDGDVHALWRRWISEGWFEWEQDGWPFWSAFHHLETWWTARHCPNVLLLHYADLLADPSAEVERLATFLAVDRTPEELQRVVDVSSFTNMRNELIESEAAAGGPAGSFFEGGAATFMNKGTNGRWRDVLTPHELAAYDKRAATLDPALRLWLENGRHADEPETASSL